MLRSPETSRGTGPRATVWGRWLGPPDAREGQALALRYGGEASRPGGLSYGNGNGGNPDTISTVFKLTVITEPMSSTIACGDSASFGELVI